MLYYKETNLKFADDIQAEVLDMCRNRLDELSIRTPQWRRILNDTPYQEIESYIGVKAAREIKFRRIAMIKKFNLLPQISFQQYSLPDHLTDALKDACPSYLPKDELIPIVQISTGGSMLYPHKGHFRKASLFCLLEGGNEITTWWKETTPFELISEYRIPDITKCEEAVSTVLKKNVWTLFNHYEWHSVHSGKENIEFRVNLGIDFKTLTAEQVYERIQHHV